MEKGISGAIVLLFAIEVLLLLNAFQNDISLNQNNIESKVLAIEKTGFERTEAEIFLDKAIETGISKGISYPIEAEKIKWKVNAEIIKAFKELGLDAKICRENFWIFEKEIEALTLDRLNKISYASAIKKESLTVIQYSITGGLESELFPCSLISNENFSNYVRIPIEYTVTRMVIA